MKLMMPIKAVKKYSIGAQVKKDPKKVVRTAAKAVGSVRPELKPVTNIISNMAK